MKELRFASLVRTTVYLWLSPVAILSTFPFLLIFTPLRNLSHSSQFTAITPTKTATMATTATEKKATGVLLRVHFPSSPSSPVQPFEHDIQLPPITTVAALLSYIELRCMAPLLDTECLDPHAVHVVWEPGLNWPDTALHDGNVRTEMGKVWMHEGRDTLVVSVTECRRSEASQYSG